MKTNSILLTVVLTGSLSSFSFSQCMMTEIPFSQKVQMSSLIIEGKVTGQSTYWNKAHTNIFTSSTVEVYKVFKGEAVAGQVEVITEGGIVGLDMERVDPGLMLGKEQVGIFFLESCKSFYNLDAEKKSAANTFRAYADMQGFVLYDLDEGSAAVPFKKYNHIDKEIYSALIAETGRAFREVKFFDVKETASKVKVTGVLAPSITSFSPTTITAGTFSELTINGSGFGANRGSSVVKFKNADNGGTNYVQPDATQYVSWSDTQIKVKVPVQVSTGTGNAGSGTIQVTVSGSTATSSSSLNVKYGVFNIQWPQSAGNPVYQMNPVDNNGTGGMTLHFSTAFASNSAAVTAFTRAYNSWKCGSYVNWEIGANTTINTQASDGTTVIRWANSNEISAGVNASTYSWWSGCAPGGDVWYLKDWDLMYNASKNWNYTTNPPSSSQNDFESTTLHELGHAQLLTHVNQAADVMYWATSPGLMLRTLTADVLAGANSVMARAAVPQSCGPGAVVLLNAGNCALAIGELAKEDQVQIFPNPSAGIFQIKMNSGKLQNTKMEIFNVVGEKINEQPVPTTAGISVDISEYPSGVYLLRLTLENGKTYFEKLIKQ